ncbi:MAG: bifunctional 2-polyprenyl-6-hydroxyphenol methylase/3-demethylubiquinol 3-O-methyltransferase UbiG [Gammaproteobacteria bacterium]|nr:bifunctional 2-polyprenyl-6-hydroxyphenol methylase/3-demethylubiquinol 3-O-methyltransferase UbiG [Gammaproteobacteria bacterium]
MTEQANANPAELAHFGALASRWWDPDGEFRTLHDINPARVDLVDQLIGLKQKRIADVGCGGGLLAEAMARRGAEVTGIDMSAEVLDVARLHLLESGPLSVSYLHMSAEDLAQSSPGSFDAVTCMELLEHVPEPASLIAACARLLKPGGSLIVSTLNRTPRAFLTAIVGAEHLTRLVPRGTHHYQQLVRPSELDAWARRAGLHLEALIGGHYNPLDRSFTLGGNVSVNYFAHFRRPDGACD